MVKLTIDGRAMEVPDGTGLFDACGQARGRALPHFCYHPDLSIAGVCRLCQVEVEGMPKLTIACNTTVREGMVVHTTNERVKRAAQQILEMHLINHPVDCPICDQAGECGLQDQYMEYGVYESEVEMADKVHKRKVQIIGPEVILDKERCVLCSRCVRFTDEVTGTRELGIFNRGDRAEIGVAPGRQLDNNYSVNTVDICPVGALTSRDFRFRKRVWMMRGASSICPGCSTGCNVRIDSHAGTIYRLKPRRNNHVNKEWMCDLGRYTYKAVHDEARLSKPFERVNGEPRFLTREEARARLGEWLGDGLAFGVASPHQSLEELFLFRRLVTRLAGADACVGGVAGHDMGAGDALLLSEDRAPNRQGARMLGLAELRVAELAQHLSRAAGQTVLVYGTDVAADPALAAAASDCQRLVYFGTHDNATARAAALVIPTAMWAEKDGIFVNRQGRFQAFTYAIAPPDGATEDRRLLVELLHAVGDKALPREMAAIRSLVGADLGLPGDVDLARLPANGFVPDAVAQPAGGNH